MRRILISTVESYAEEYANCITAEKKNGLANWRKMPVDRLRELYYTLKWQGEYWLADYVLAIMQYLKEIVLLILISSMRNILGGLMMIWKQKYDFILALRSFGN